MANITYLLTYLFTCIFLIKLSAFKTGKKAFKFVKKGLQERCFSLKLAKFLRTPFLKNFCERLLLTDDQWHSFPSFIQSKRYFYNICFPSAKVMDFIKMPICILFDFSYGSQHYRVEFCWQKNINPSSFCRQTPSVLLFLQTIKGSWLWLF